MWTYERRLQYPVNITKTNAEMAKVIITQFGGPDGELAASQRYLSQRYSTQNRKVAGVLTDIGVAVIKLHINIPKRRLTGINRHAEYVISWYNEKRLQIIMAGGGINSNEKEQKGKPKKTQKSVMRYTDMFGFYFTCTHYLLWNCAPLAERGVGLH